MLIAESITKRFPTRAEDLIVLRGVTLRLESGESLAIMGPSGCGKSTLLNILGTLEPPTGGSLRVDDTDPFTLSDRDLARFRNQRIGFVFQDHHLMPQCSVLENVLLPTIAGPSSDTGRSGDSEARARSLLSAVGLSGRLDHRPAELSGGEKQRAAVARALVNRPSLILADEPTGNLDQATAEQIGNLLAELPKRDKLMLVVVTHSPELARRFDRTMDLREGELIPR